MKKSKFLQNSKDVLSRSFNPAKCKTSLRLAGSRLKLLRNKKEVQVKQMKKEIAKLLESDQDQNARIRVEQVIREEKMMAAYDLLEIYCELIVSRLPIIESQKNIPIDLKEAIASIVFASPRCGDVPELLDIRKHFTAKYGKDYTTAAIELRPECGVGRLLVEKLSAVAPDGQAKTKILSAIAEEHNVNWDPKSSDEKDPVPSNDLLSGPIKFGKASTLYAEAPHSGDPDIQVPPLSSDNKIHYTTFNVSQQNPKTSVGTENLSSAQNYGISLTSQPETRPTGDKKTQLFLDENYASSLDRQRWNMEFKDATAAAQAAAESAERASMAARAAAELSNRDRIMRQHSSSEVHVSSNEGRENYETSKFASKPFTEDSGSKPFLEETEPQIEQIDRGRPYNEKTSGSFKENSRGSTKEYVQSTSLKSKASKDNDTKDHDVLAAGVDSKKNSLKMSRGEMSKKKQSFMYEAENTNDWPEKSENFREETIEKQSSVNFSSDFSISDDVNIFADSNDRKFGHVAVEDSFVDFAQNSIKYDSESLNDWPEKSKHFMEEKIVKMPSVVSSRAHSIISDVENIFVNSKGQTFGHEVDEDPFVDISKGRIPGEASQISTHEAVALVFDKSDSESDSGYDFGTTYDVQESVFHLPSKLPENSVNSDSWSPISGSTKILQSNTQSLFSTRKNSSPDLSGNLVAKGSDIDDMAVRFDYSDGPSSESDDGMNILGHTVKQDSRDISSTQYNSSSRSVRSEIKDKSRESLGSPLREKGYSGLGRKQSSLSSDDEVMSEEIFKERDQGKTPSPGKLSFRKSAAGKKKEYSGFGRKQPSLLSDDEVMTEEILEKHSQRKSNPSGKLSFRKSSSGKPASRSAESQIESIELGNESNLDSGKELNFGKLTGGFRHKGYNQPSYLKNRLGGQSVLKETGAAATSNVRSLSPPAVVSPRVNKMFGNKKGTKIPILSSDSDSDSSEEEKYIQKSSGRRKGGVTPNSAEDKKSSLGASRSNYGSSSNNLDNDDPEESLLARKNHPRSGISRRTKAHSSSAKPSSFPNTQWKESETPDSDATGHRKSRVSDTSENQQNSESPRKNSEKLENYERPTSANVPYKPAKSNFWAPPEQAISAKAANGMLHASKMRLTSEALDDDAGNYRNPVKTQHKKSEVLDSDEDEKGSNKTNISETPRELESERKNSMNWENYKSPTSMEVASKPTNSSVFTPPKQHKVASKPSHPNFSGIPEQHNSAEPTTSTTPEPRTPHKSSASEKPPSPQTKAETSVSNENPKTATLMNKTNSNKGGDTQKPSHVHPKLPDYDSFIQAFRKNRP